MQRYERAFGQAPPKDLWPPVEERFAPRQLQWVDRSRHWVLPRPAFLSSRRLRAAGVGLGTAAGTLFLTGCVANVFDYQGSAFLKLYASLLPLALLACWWLGRALLPKEHPHQGDSIKDPYDIAFLAGGPSRFFQTLIAKLYTAKKIELQVKKKGAVPEIVRAADETADGLQGVERQIYAAVPSRHSTSLRDLSSSLKPVYNEAKDRLAQAGLLIDQTDRWKAQMLASLPMIALLFLGGAKVAVGIARDKPVGFLIALMVVTLMFLVARLSCVARRTRAGHKIWKQLRGEHEADLAKRLQGSRGEDLAAYVPLAVAVLGTSAMASVPEYAPLDGTLRSMSAGQGGGGGGCGSGCGGGGCGGGGCGGCGGCGG